MSLCSVRGILTDANHIGLSPKELIFDGKGGTKTVTVDTNLDDLTVSPNDSWLSASYDKAGKTISVTAEENAKSQRDGIVIVKGGDIADTVRVIQAAAVGEFDFSQCKAIRVSIKAYVKYDAVNTSGGTDSGTSMQTFEFWNSDFNFEGQWTVSVSSSGTGAHIEGKMNNKFDFYINSPDIPGYHYETCDLTISIDIDDVVSGKITNMTIKQDIDDYAEILGVPRHLYTNRTATASNIPLPGRGGKTTGNKSAGTTISSLSEVYHGEVYDKTTSLVGSDDDSITIQFITSGMNPGTVQ